MKRLFTAWQVLFGSWVRIQTHTWTDGRRPMEEQRWHAEEKLYQIRSWRLQQQPRYVPDPNYVPVCIRYWIPPVTKISILRRQAS